MSRGTIYWSQNDILVTKRYTRGYDLFKPFSYTFGKVSAKQEAKHPLSQFLLHFWRSKKTNIRYHIFSLLEK